MLCVMFHYSPKGPRLLIDEFLSNRVSFETRTRFEQALKVGMSDQSYDRFRYDVGKYITGSIEKEKVMDEKSFQEVFEQSFDLREGIFSEWEDGRRPIEVRKESNIILCNELSLLELNLTLFEVGISCNALLKLKVEEKTLVLCLCLYLLAFHDKLCR